VFRTNRLFCGLPVTTGQLRDDRIIEETLARRADPLHLAAAFGPAPGRAMRVPRETQQGDLLRSLKWKTKLKGVEDSLYEQGHPLLTDEELAGLDEIGHTIRRTAGNAFMLEGEYGDFALLMKKGHVKITVGRPPRIVAIRGPGDMIGEMAAIRRKPRSASVFAIDEVEALYLPAARWLRFLYDHPRAMFAQLVAEAERTEQATRKIVESELAVGQQLAKALIQLLDSGIGKHTSSGPVELRLSQQDLAAMIGAKKLDSVKKVIRQLKAAGTLATGRQQITILEPGVLRGIANGDLAVS
jgi:CRP/FNR family transcriptional regulator, cyclic AMP receptor protein